MKWSFMRHNPILLEPEMEWAGKPSEYPDKTSQPYITPSLNTNLLTFNHVKPTEGTAWEKESLDL